ncbi:MAG TPA: acyclic terpene utilization AtuA family protein [Acidimicrobiales bacterium]|nr:acyclic terpene utilization AtuA family protein [Acidimicrobiales bacterium]
MALRIGAGQGFTGDDPRGTREVLEDGVDYLCCDALAEITLTSIYRERQQDERAGYARDVATVAELALPGVADGVRLVTNAGALNPLGARDAVVGVARRLGIDRLRVGVVLGSDLTVRVAELASATGGLRHADTGEVMGPTEDVEFAAAYLGAWPIVEALGDGADVVVTGRVADTSVFMAPAMYELGLARDDWVRLGRLAIMGHLMECSTQVTGGNFSGRWWEVPGLDVIGFPIAEVDDDAEVVITKPQGSGGLVSPDTVKEQLLYEVGDPTRYLTPDVVADMTSAALRDDGPDRVRVAGATGTPATDSYKVILSRRAGWSAAAALTYTYPGAMAKARAAKEVLDRRLERAGVQPLETWVEYVGAGAMWGEADGSDLPEVVLRYAVRCPTREEAAAVLVERIRALSIGGPPGAAASGMGTSPPMPVSEIWPTLVSKELIDPQVKVVVEDL